MLYRKGHVSTTTGKIEIVLRVSIQLIFDGTTNMFVQHIVLKSFDNNAIHERFFDFQKQGQTLYTVGFLFGRNKQKNIPAFVVFLGEKISWQRIAFI